MKLIRRNILISDDCYAVSALAIFLQDFGTEGLDWLPETVFREMEARYGELPTTTLNRLMAAIEILTSDIFYRRVDKFIDFVNILNHGHLEDFIADFGEIAWALTEILYIDPPEVEDPLKLFSSSVLTYIEQAFLRSGLTIPPSVFKQYKIILPDKINTVLQSYADNPELFGALYEASTVNTEILERIIAEKVAELEYQLAQIAATAPKHDITVPLDQPKVIPS